MAPAAAVSASAGVPIAASPQSAPQPKIDASSLAAPWPSQRRPLGVATSATAVVVAAAVVAGAKPRHSKRRLSTASWRSRHRRQGRGGANTAVCALGGESMVGSDGGVAFADGEDNAGSASVETAQTYGAQPAEGHSGNLPTSQWADRFVQFNGSSLEPGETLDYVSVRLQSPSEIRNAARFKWTNKAGIAEVTSPVDFHQRVANPDGLRSTTLFGEKTSVGRRYQMGCMNLAWPCSHVWFTGTAKSAKVAKLLQQAPVEIFDVRQYKRDMYHGEWTGANLLPLRQKLASNAPELPAVGSPVAAQAQPVVKRGIFSDVEAHRVVKIKPAARSTAEAEREQATERELASGIRSAWVRHAAPEAVRRSRAAQHAVELVSANKVKSAQLPALGQALALAAELPQLVLEALATAHLENTGTGSSEGLGRAEQVVPHLVRNVADRFAKFGLDAETSATLIRSIVQGDGRGEPSLDSVPELLSAARQNFKELWTALAAPTAPGSAGTLSGEQDRGEAFELGARLSELREAFPQHLDAYEGARVKMAAKKLQGRAYAALDIALKAYESSFGLAAAEAQQSGFTAQQQESRFNPGQQEVCWYDPEMAPASFHLEDVQRVSDRVQWDEKTAVAFGHLAESARYSLGEQSSPSPPGRKPGVRPKAKAAARGITRPSLRSARQSTDVARWQVPHQDSTRQGRAGGARVMQAGQVLPLGAGDEIARFHAIRPRPAFAPPSVPANLEVEGALFVNTGGAALRQALCNIETQSYARATARQGASADAAIFVQERLERLTGLGFVTDTTAGMALKLVSDTEVLQKKLLWQRRSMEAMAHKVQAPESMIFMTFPLLPPDLRTGSSQEETADDLHNSYKNTLKRGDELIESLQRRDTAGLFRYRKMQLQDQVDVALDNGRVSPAQTKNNGDALESVAARLKGKQGRMRLNLLGKRVDYSARTVIVVDPTLELDECRVPFQIAREVFKGFLIAVVRETYPHLKDVINVHEIMDFFDEELDEETQFRLMREAMGDRLVMLNRAPTLHRLSVQAFRPRLIGGQALKIHPLVCSPFNADFDGDTMTMHLALSKEAQEELRTLMMPSCNLNSPADGSPVIGPTQDMVLGIYYLTADPPDPDATAVPFSDLEAVSAAHAAGDVIHSTVITLPIDALRAAAPDAVEHDSKLQDADDEVRTTVGRALFFRCVHCAGKPTKTESDLLVQDLEAQLDSLPGMMLQV